MANFNNLFKKIFIHEDFMKKNSIQNEDEIIDSLFKTSEKQQNNKFKYDNYHRILKGMMQKK